MSQHSTSDLATAESPAWPCPPLPFPVAGSLWLVAVYAVSRAQPVEIVFVGASVLLLGVPIGLAGLYTSRLRWQYRLVLFRKQQVSMRLREPEGVSVGRARIVVRFGAAKDAVGR